MVKCLLGVVITGDQLRYGHGSKWATPKWLSIGTEDRFEIEGSPRWSPFKVFLEY